jgi:hypothetical protein
VITNMRYCVFLNHVALNPKGLATLQMLDRSDRTKLRGENSQRLATSMFTLICVDSQALMKLR